MTTPKKREKRPVGNNPLAAIDIGQLHAITWKDLVARFVFGATVSVVAGVVGLNFGARVGGILLAFPAILPATLTLIAKEEGQPHSFHDLQGTVVGACGLVGFGIVAAFTIGRVNVIIALLAALLAWCVVSGTLYLVWATWLRKRGVQL